MSEADDMGEQRTLGSVAYDTKGKVTRRERFLRPPEPHSGSSCEGTHSSTDIFHSDVRPRVRRYVAVIADPPTEVRSEAYRPASLIPPSTTFAITRYPASVGCTPSAANSTGNPSLESFITEW